MSISSNTTKALVFVLSISFAFNHSLASNSSPLSLTEAERLALEQAPELEKLKASQASLEQKAIAEGQLPDPQLMVGAINVPTDSFSFRQDDMTMVEVGLQQALPPGDTLDIKSRQSQHLASAENRKHQDQTLMLLKNVRQTWLNLYYLLHALQVIQENQVLYKELLAAAKSQYEVGKGAQSDLLQFQLEQSRLGDQIIQLQQQMDTARAQLGRWIGVDQANRTLASTLPRWPEPPSLDSLSTQLSKHPLLEVDTAMIDAAQDELDLANEQYKPGWMVDLSYGIRQGNMACCGGRRSDMMTAKVSVDLPLFTTNRQDRRAQASIEQLKATKLDQQVHYRDLRQELGIQYANWQRLTAREKFYQEHLIAEAEQNTTAALTAYKNATTDMTTVLRATTSELNIKLEGLQIQIEAAKARASLLYIEGKFS